jgi:CubicO group peptidase (beta-lactamase class C family)
MIKLFKLLIILATFLLLLTACNQPAQSILPTPGVLDAEAQDKATKLDQFFQKKADEGAFSGAVIVFQDGEILLNKGYGFSDREKKTPISYDTRFRLDHATMPFTSMAIWTLYDQGKLDPEVLVCSLIDNCPESWAELTIMDLLNNTSQIPDFTFTPHYKNSRSEATTLDKLVNQIKNLPLDPYLSVSSWCGDSNYILLAAIIEKVSSQDYESFVTKEILEPLGLKNTGLILGQGEKESLARQYKGAGESDIADPLDMSNLYSAAGMYSTIEDSYLFLYALVNRKVLNGDKMAALTQGMELIPWWTENSYTTGSGWITFQFEGTVNSSMMCDSNWKGSYLAYRPEDNSGFIILVNQDSSPWYWGADIVPILNENQ